MALQHSLTFDPSREVLDGRGWKYSWWDDAQTPQPVTTVERLYRIDRPSGGANSSVQAVSNKALTSNVATITTASAHGFVVGDWVTIALTVADPVFDGDHLIASVPTTTTFTFSKTNANVVSVAAAGAATSAASAFERIKTLASADAATRAYFLAQAQAAVLTANSSAVNSTRDAALSAEGLIP